MDKSKISKIIIEAESKMATLDAALDRGNNDTATWTLLILSGIIQDLRRFADEEPLPIEIDKRKLSQAFDTTLAEIRDVWVSTEEREYRLARTYCVLLGLALDDIRELFSEDKIENRRSLKQRSPDLVKDHPKHMVELV